MALNWNCDICGKDTYVHPPTEPIFDSVQVEYQEPVVDEKTGQVTKYEKKIRVDKVPRMTEYLQQDPFTGEMKKVPVQAVLDLHPRTFIVRLSVGQEVLQRDFCKECYQECIQDATKTLWNVLLEKAPISR